MLKKYLTMFFVLTPILKFGNFWLRGCLAVALLSLGMYAQAKPLKGDSTGRKVMTCAMPGVPGTVNGSTCGPGNVTLTAYPTPPGANPAIMKPMMAQPQSLPGGGGTITYTTRWYYASSGGTYFAEGTTQTFNVSSTTTYYVSTHSSAGCESARVPVTATVTVINPAYAGPNQAKCYVGATTLAATSPAQGSGAWSVYSGPSTSPSQFSGTGNPTATFTPAGGAGTYVLTWKVTNASCTSSSNVTLSFTNTPTTANAGPYQNGSSTCGLTSVALAANTPTVGAGRWSVAPDSPTRTGYSFGNTNSPTTSFSGIAGGNYDLVWTITNGACTSTSDTFILFNQNPSPAQAGSNQTICANSSATLGANTPTVGSGAWSVSSGPSTSPSQFSSTGNPTATFTPAGGAGTYTLTWTISKSPCAASASNMTVTVNAVPTAANAGADQTGSATCGLTSVTLAANTPGTGTGNWSIVSGSGGTVTSPGSANSSFSGTAGSAYTLRWTTSNGVCSSSTDDVQVAFNRVPSTSSAGADQAVCGLTQVTLAASTPTLGGGSWSIVSGAGGTVASPGSASSTFSGTAGSTYTLRWTVSNSPCTASTDDLSVTFNKNPTPANAGSNYSQCGLEGKTLTANTPTVGTGAWSVVSGPSSSQGQFSSPASPAAVFTPAGGAGSYVLQWTINNAGCVSTSNVTLTFTDAPTVSHAGSDRTDSTTCGLTSVTLAANAPTVGTGRWSVAPDSPTGTGYSFGNTNSPTSTFSGTAGGTYDLVWTVTNGSCTSTSEIYVTFGLVPTVAATANPTLCSGDSTSITLSNPNNLSGTTYRWNMFADNAVAPPAAGTGPIIAGRYYNSDGVNDGTVTYLISAKAGICVGSAITAKVNIKNTPVTPAPSTFIAYGINPATLTVLVPPNTYPKWYEYDPNDHTFTYTNDTTHFRQFAYDDTPVHSYYASLVDKRTGCETQKSLYNAVFLLTINPSSITSETLLTKGQTNDAAINALSPTQKNTTISYTDGLGRSIQTLALNASADGKDLVLPMEYDNSGRASKQYLPYLAANTSGQFQLTYAADQSAFYSTPGDKVADDPFAFARAAYEPSPLGRILEQGASGTTWQLGYHTNRTSYSFNSGATNSDADEVRKFASDGSSTGFYPANVLAKFSVKDENKHTAIVFKDHLGNIIARKQQLDGTINGSTVSYLQTYYVYDALHRLKYIITPGGVAALKTNGWNLSAAVLNQHVHQFAYDERGRLTQKKTPGQDWAYYVYDNLNRLILTQDGNLRLQNKWAFVKYDVWNRQVMAGLYKNTVQTTLSAMQSWANSRLGGGNVLYERKTTTSPMYGYTNLSFPTANSDNSALEIYRVNYFDDYDFDSNGTADFTYDNAHLGPYTTPDGQAVAMPAKPTAYLRGKATGSRKLILDGTNNHWITSAVFYDNFGRAIQTQTNNFLNLTGLDKSSVTYDFEGKVAQAKTTHSPDGTTVTNILQTPNYDAQGRLSKVYHSINGAANQLVAQYEYNGLGQVVTKKLHSNDGTNFLQNVDYRYNIRGWLAGINNAQLANDGGVTNADTNDYFGMELLYDVRQSGLNGNANTDSIYYNGNVSAIKWKNAGDAGGVAGQRSYKFIYDKTDKLLNAYFQKSTATDWSAEPNTFNEAMTYDHNGNISALQRNRNAYGLQVSGGVPAVTSAATTIDNLTYNYTYGNRLNNVADATANEAGFADVPNAASVKEYTYDTLGNLTADKNKGIDSIKYNALGKACRIKMHDGRVIAYTYDAAGSKLAVATTANGVIATTYYANGFVYTSATNVNNNAIGLSFFPSPEGRVVKNGNTYEYQYAITDHQGNTRVVFTSAAPTPQVSTATFETADQPTETTQFDNYGHISGAANHTPGGTNSQHLNGGYAGMVGVAKSYKVYPGDQLKIEAYGSYLAPTGSSSRLADLAAALISAFNLPTPAPGETATAAAGLSTWGTLAAGGYGDGSDDTTDPKAFVNIVLFDKDHNFLDVAYAQLKGTELYYLSASYTVKEAGYAYLYVSNEQPVQTDVYFDDVTMTYTPSNILQSSEYYPFGLQTQNSWTRDNTTNNFLYNRGTELNNTTGVYDTPFRGYDPTLGRFMQIDPLAHMSSSLTPYHYASNNPVNFNDPTGLQVPVSPITREDWHAYWEYADSGYQGSFEDWCNDGNYDYGAPSGNPYLDASKIRAGYMSQERYNQYYGSKTGNGYIGFVEYLVNGEILGALSNYSSRAAFWSDVSAAKQAGGDVQLRAWNIDANNYASWLASGMNSELAVSSASSPGLMDYANDYNNRVLNVAGAVYGLYDQALNQNPQIRIGIANKLSSFFGGSAGLHNQALKRLGETIASKGNIVGGVGLGISLGNAAYQTYQGKDNTAMWVDTVISTTLFLGSVIPNPLQPLFIGGSLIYGGARLGAGDQIDNVINANLGYR